MIRNLWNKLTGVDRLRARIDFLEKSLMHKQYSLQQTADLAYERRRVLREIAACETPNSNGTVKRMAKIARQAIDVPVPNTDRDVSR